MIHIRTYVMASTDVEVDKVIETYTVPKGYRAIILELGFTLPATGIINGYVGETKVDQIRGEYATVIARRVLVNRELVAGQYWKFTLTSTATGTFVVLIVYELIKI